MAQLFRFLISGLFFLAGNASQRGEVHCNRSEELVIGDLAGWSGDVGVQLHRHGLQNRENI